MVGERLREARNALELSLADVAAMANVSAATLSRIEREKQTIDLGLFLTLARVLRMAPADLLADGDGDGELAARIAAMQARDRTKLWRQIAEERRERRTRRGADFRNMAQEVEALLAQVDFLREEIDSVRTRLAHK